MNRSTRMTRTSATASTTTLPWRRVAASLVALALLSVLTLSLASAADAQPRASAASSATANQPKIYQPSGKGTALAHGVVDLAKLPTIQPHAVTSVQTPPLPAPDALTPAQRQAYNDRMRKTPPTSITTRQQMQAPSAAPKFVGGGSIPLLVKQFEGINSTQATSGTSEAAIATDLSYVMEGTDHAIAIYSAASGAKLFGPYSPDTFFAPVKHAGYTFAYPQMYYDTMRDRWLVLYLEIAPGGTVTYLDLAVSATTSPTQPTPGAQYHVYQFAANFAPSGGVNSVCAYEALGVDYWGIYITCTNYRLGGFAGNTVLAINKAPMLSGAIPNTWFWNDALKITGDVTPALILSPATEEGVQDAEFIVATDAGFGITSNSLSMCALTNQRNIDAVAPTISCVHEQGIFGQDPYADPIPARQPGGPNTINPGFGTKQVYYKAGQLFLAWTTRCSIIELHDCIVGAELRPQLNFDNPQVLIGIEVTESYFVIPPSGEDYYTPSIVGTDEDDTVLVYNRSGTSTFPGIAYTGRKASDHLGSMGRGANAVVVSGTHTTTTYWGKYAACAISLNSVTRGGVWCVGEYTGSVADPGWNTRLYNLRAE